MNVSFSLQRAKSVQYPAISTLGSMYVVQMRNSSHLLLRMLALPPP